MRVIIYLAIAACIAGCATPKNQATQTTEDPAPTLLADGELAFEGWWDSGNCNGGDRLMCDPHSGTGQQSGATDDMIGCIVEAKQCRSGLARAEATQIGDGICVYRWWGYGCYSEDAPRWSEAQAEDWRDKTFQRMRDERVRYAIRRAQSYPPNPCSFPDDIGKQEPLTIAFAMYEGWGEPAKYPWLASNHGVKSTFLDIDEALANQPQPFMLVVSTYEPVLFKLSDRLQEKLVGVISTGYYPSRFESLPRDIPVYFTSFVGDEVRANNCPHIEPVWANGVSDAHLLDRIVWKLIPFYGVNDASIDYIRHESRAVEMVLTKDDVAPPPPPLPPGEKIVVTPGSERLD